MRTYYPAVLDRTSHMRKDPVILCNFPDNSFHYGVVRQVAGGISQCFKTCRARKSYVALSSTVWNDCSDVFPRRASVSQRHTSRFTLHTSRFTLPQQLLSEFSSFRDHMRIIEVLSSSQLFELFQVAESRYTV